jgi:hypothetical protein
VLFSSPTKIFKALVPFATGGYAMSQRYVSDNVVQFWFAENLNEIPKSDRRLCCFWTAADKTEKYALIRTCNSTMII